MYKNTASQKWIVFAFGDEGHANPGEPVTGLADITANLYLDGSATPNAVDDVNPTELGGGYYAFDITAAESNANSIVIAPSSATANVNVIGVPGAVYTRTDVSAVEGKIDTIDGNVDAILLDTAEIGVAGAGLTAVPWNATWDVEVESEVTDALTAYNAVATTDLPTNFSDLAITVTTGQVTAGTVADKTGYSLTQSFPANFADLSITATTGLVDVNVNNDKTGYSISGTLTTLDALDTAQDAQHSTTQGQLTTIDANVDAVLLDTGTDGVVLAADQAVDVTKIAGNATSASNLRESTLGIIPGTVQTGTTTTTIETNLTEAVDDVFVGRTIVFLTGVLQNEATSITAYNGTTKALTVQATAQQGADGDTFVIV